MNVHLWLGNRLYALRGGCYARPWNKGWLDRAMFWCWTKAYGIEDGRQEHV